MSEKYTQEYCTMNSHANTAWQTVMDTAQEDTESWITEMEFAEHLLSAMGMKRAARLLTAADIKVTAELYRIETKIGENEIID